jgi:hypothetical protein
MAQRLGEPCRLSRSVKEIHSIIYRQRTLHIILVLHAESFRAEILWTDHAFDKVFTGASSQVSPNHMERFLAGALMKD